MVIEPIFENRFAKHSDGFRPGRGCKDALRRVEALFFEMVRYADDMVISGGTEISVPLTDSAEVTGTNPQAIVACGSEFSAGIAALQRFPEAHLILVHPPGKPDFPDGFIGKVSVILPMLDMRNSGRGWKVIGKEKGWTYSMCPGVLRL